MMSDVVVVSPSHEHDGDYQMLLSRVRQRVVNAASKGPFVTTTANEGGALWRAYLDGFPAESRQFHNCHACRQFIESYGHLAVIDGQGKLHSACWDEGDAPPYYAPAVAQMARLVKRAYVTGVFRTRARVWGRPQNEAANGHVWTHFSAELPVGDWFSRVPGKASADRAEAARMIQGALDDFPLSLIQEGVSLLKNGQLYRAETILPQAAWFLGVAQDVQKLPKSLRTNYVWRVAATAPLPFCHIRGGMVGRLLALLREAPGDYAGAIWQFNAQMHPLAYRRPQANPTQAAVRAAENLVGQLGTERAFARRFARMEDIETIWQPIAQRDSPLGGLFAGVPTQDGKGVRPSRILPNPVTMTWEKFSREVLPDAGAMQVYCMDGDSYCAFLTAQDPDAPPILQWDEEPRNPVSWYFWNGGATAQSFSLNVGLNPVRAISLQPTMWHGKADRFARYGKGVLFVIAGAQETRSFAMALFPETLKSEYHGIRATVEAYSAAHPIELAEEPHVAGIMKQAGAWGRSLRLQVSLKDGTTVSYILDRWD